MVTIKLDTQTLSQERGLDERQARDLVDSVVKYVTRRFYEKWMDQTRSLKSSRKLYQNSLMVVDSGVGKGSVVLVSSSRVPLMIELGASPFDMKVGFMRSSKVKFNKAGGWYLTIPFRWAAPDSLGESEVFQGNMPEEIHAIVKAKEANIPISGGMRSEGILNAELPPQFQSPNIRPEVMAGDKRFEEYVHKTSLYEGITKVQDTMTGQNRYMSFRRVGENSDSNAFIHTGIIARNLAQQAFQGMDFEREVEVAQDRFLRTL